MIQIIPQMRIWMAVEAVDFRRGIDGLAGVCREVLKNDDLIDEMNKRVVRDLVEAIRKDPAHLDQSLELIRVSRNLERVADLSTNIAEEVIFMAEATVVKHRFRDREPSP